jgi:hypothetical protein
MPKKRSEYYDRSKQSVVKTKLEDIFLPVAWWGTIFAGGALTMFGVGLGIFGPMLVKKRMKKVTYHPLSYAKRKEIKDMAKKKGK